MASVSIGFVNASEDHVRNYRSNDNGTRSGWAISSLGLLMGCLLVLASALPASAQRYLGSIQGEVSDPSGAKIAGATILVEEASTHFKSSDTANASGNYTISSLNPGTYTVTVKAPGFKTETKTSVVLTAGQLAEADFRLVPGTQGETVQVTAENTLLDTGSANIATTLSAQEVTDLPNEGRNPFVQEALAPGMIPSTGNYFQSKSSQYTNPYSGFAVAVTVDGISGHNRLTLDGIPDDAAERFSGASYTNFVPSPEAVQETKVQNGMFDAQIGHGDGTVTNVVVRNGTNQLHGSAYYVFQDTYLNANTYEKAGLRQPRNNDQVSQTGIVIDGPVVLPKIYNGRDKTFFMFSFERYATHTALNYSSRVPTAAELAGDFSGLCSSFNGAGLCTSGVQLYVPNSPLDANGNRTQYYANNNIATALNATGKAFASYMPSPNVPNSSALTNPNYVATQTSYPSTYPSFIAPPLTTRSGRRTSST